MDFLVGRSRSGRQSASKRLATRRPYRLQVYELVDHPRRHLCAQVRRRFDRAVAPASLPDDGVPDVFGKGAADLSAFLVSSQRVVSCFACCLLKSLRAIATLGSDHCPDFHGTLRGRSSVLDFAAHLRNSDRSRVWHA